ncbi:MAG: hypothetical protein WC938_02175 [Candidatus Paceibacterota bacterium]|jgi:hypothetical protein
MGFLLIIFIIWLAWIILSAIVEWIKQSIKDSAARSALENFDYEKEKNNILAINKQYNFKEMNSKNSTLNAKEELMWQSFIDKLQVK